MDPGQRPRRNPLQPRCHAADLHSGDVGPEGASLTFQLTVNDFSNLKAQDTCVVNITWQNQPPVANAGSDQQSDAGTQVTLNGSGSSDSDDGIAAYRWKQIAGSPVTLSDSTAAVTTFQAPAVTADTNLTFELTVTDCSSLLGVDTCQVQIKTAYADTTPPTIVITDPAGSFLVEGRPKIDMQAPGMTAA